MKKILLIVVALMCLLASSIFASPYDRLNGVWVQTDLFEANQEGLVINMFNDGIRHRVEYKLMQTDSNAEISDPPGAVVLTGEVLAYEKNLVFEIEEARDLDGNFLQTVNENLRYYYTIIAKDGFIVLTMEGNNELLMFIKVK